MTGCPVLWLCGPPGVGKSAAAWALFSEYAHRGVVGGYVDIDQLGIRYPAPADDPHNTSVKAVNLASVLRSYRAAGADRVVVSGVALPGEVPQFEAEVGPSRITWVRLHADRGRLHDRFVRGDGPAELLPDVDRHAEALARSQFAHTWIDTTSLGVADVVEAVETAVPGWPDLPARGGGSATSSHPTGTTRETSQDQSGRVLLLCGPRAVGTSTVGWEVFQRLQRHGTAAFVDLAQVGFVGAASALPLGRHRVRARNLAALAATYHRGGADVVVAVGSVLTDGELHEYADALPPGSLTVCRLHATPRELERRIHARTAPAGGPHLAGDDLRGRSAANLQPVVRQALAEAELLQQSGLGDFVVDTTGRSVSDCATEVLSQAQFA